MISVADEPAGARLDRRDAQAACATQLAEPDGEAGQVGERVVGHGLPPLRLVGRVRRGEQPGLGHARLARARPSDVPFSVKCVTPDDPVRTSTDSLPVKVSVLPLVMTLPAAPSSGSILPSTQTLSQARPPLTRDDEVDALVGDRDVAGQGRRLALGARRR